MALSLRIWRFTDGRPGHEKQTAGLLQGFRECLPVYAGQEAELAVRDVALADYADDWSALWQDPGDAPDLLIGAGRRTHLPMARTRWHLGSRSIVLMKPSLPSFAMTLRLCPSTIARGRSARCCALWVCWGRARPGRKHRIMGLFCWVG